MSDIQKILRNIVLNSLVADSHALATHWVYNANQIKNHFTKGLDGLFPPLASYHSNRKAGEFTMYGDPLSWLLESIVNNQNTYSSEKYAKLFKERFATYDGYKDGASKRFFSTGDNYDYLNEKASTSGPGDFGGVRFSPFLYLHYNADLSDYLKAVNTATKLIYNNEDLLEVTEFVAEVSYRLLHANHIPNSSLEDKESFNTPSKALKYVANRRNNSYISSTVEKVFANLDKTPSEAGALFGVACSYRVSFPLALYFIAKYENEPLNTTLIQNSLVGGDTAARAISIATVISSYKGSDATLPKEWYQLSAIDQINANLDKLAN